INKAEKLGLRLVCNDPFGEWGEQKIGFSELYKFIGSYFYASKDEVKGLVNGIGYSTYHHYIFGIRSNSGELLAVYFLAKWPWGFEGTYTMVKPNRTRLGLARILMLFSHVL